MKQSFGWMQSSLFSLYGDKLCNKKVQSAVARSSPIRLREHLRRHKKYFCGVQNDPKVTLVLVKRVVFRIKDKP